MICIYNAWFTLTPPRENPFYENLRNVRTHAVQDSGSWPWDRQGCYQWARQSENISYREDILSSTLQRDRRLSAQWWAPHFLRVALSPLDNIECLLYRMCSLTSEQHCNSCTSLCRLSLFLVLFGGEARVGPNTQIYRACWHRCPNMRGKSVWHRVGPNTQIYRACWDTFYRKHIL